MKPYYEDESVTLLLGDAAAILAELPTDSVDCIVTSPPYYGLRDYGIAGQIGMESSPAAYVSALVDVFHAARGPLGAVGTLWLNLGDCYSSESGGAPQSGNADTSGTRVVRPRAQDFVSEKNLLGMPWRVAFALQDDGWTLRNAIVWHKPNGMPSSVTDRVSTRYELVFLFTPNPQYYFDLDAIRVPHAPSTIAAAARARIPYTAPGQKTNMKTRAMHDAGANPGDVWSIPTQPYPEAHFATFPIELPRRCLEAGSRPSGVILDPFSGSGTTGAAAVSLGRSYIGIDLNPAYHDLAKQRFQQGCLDFGAAS